jgi:hypothetical protein
MMRFQADRFQADQEVWRVVEKFERCEFKLEEFDHAHHLAVGMAYLSQGSLDEAMDRMRVALKRFSAHHGKMGFHETLTRFWLLRLGEIEAPELWSRVNRAVEVLGNKDLIYDYYDRDVVMSAEARALWVEPQRTPRKDVTSQILVRGARGEGRIPD